MHGLHLLEAPRALAEMHRLLKPGGRLVVAWNDRDLGNCFIEELEECMEAHLPAYSRALCQHPPAAWAAPLAAGGRFRLAEYSCHANPVALRNLASLSDVLNCQPYVRGMLRGAARKAFNADVAALTELRFGEGPLLLPMQTRLYVLQKLEQ